MANILDTVENVVAIDDDADYDRIPVASTTAPGIAQFDSEDFTVTEDGKVSSLQKAGAIQYIGTISSISDGTITWNLQKAGGKEVSEVRAGDFILALTNDDRNGDIYIVTSVIGNVVSTSENRIGTLLGPQGIQGPQGVQGPTGPRGVQGEKGESGASINIQQGIYYVTDKIVDTDLPLPDFDNTLEGNAYVVRDNLNVYDLYMHNQDATDWTIINDWGGVPGPIGKSALIYSELYYSVAHVQAGIIIIQEKYKFSRDAVVGDACVINMVDMSVTPWQTYCCAMEVTHVDDSYVTLIANNIVLITGPQGLQGLQGQRGLQGETGDRGPQGIQGIQGVKGDQGIQGPQGIQGTQGVPGKDGSSFQISEHVENHLLLPTASADYASKAYSVGIQYPYDIYVCELKDGTYSWINHGPIQGPQGEMGPQGPQGVQGKQGVQGIQGIQGVQGPIGLQGPAGISALVYNNVYYSVSQVIVDLQIVQEVEKFNRAADIGDNCVIVCIDMSSSFWRTYMCACVVLAVDPEWVTLSVKTVQDITGEVGPQGAKGDAGAKGDTGSMCLTYNEVFYSSSVVQPNLVITQEVAKFNRTAVIGDDCIIVCSDMTTSPFTTYITTCKVTNVSDTFVTLSVIKAQNITGAQGSKGEQGAQGIPGPQGTSITNITITEAT